MTPTPGFTVDRELVSELIKFIAEAVARSTYTRVEVSAADFPAWCAALGVESFMAYRGKNSHTWVSTNHSYTSCSQPDVHVEDPNEGKYPGCVHEHHLVSVACDTPPAPWVEFPAGEGDRRYMFRAA